MTKNETADGSSYGAHDDPGEETADGSNFRDADDAGSELGFSLHDWQSVWASVEKDLQDDPDAALSELADLVERMLLAKGYAVHDRVAGAGEEREVIATYLSAREVAERAELGNASRGEVETAIEDLRSIFTSFDGDEFEPAAGA